MKVGRNEENVRLRGIERPSAARQCCAMDPHLRSRLCDASVLALVSFEQGARRCVEGTSRVHEHAVLAKLATHALSMPTIRQRQRANLERRGVRQRIYDTQEPHHTPPERPAYQKLRDNTGTQSRRYRHSSGRRKVSSAGSRGHTIVHPPVLGNPTLRRGEAEN